MNNVSVHDRFIPKQILVATVRRALGENTWTITVFRNFGLSDNVDYSLLESRFVLQPRYSSFHIEVSADRLDEFEEALDATTVAFMLERRWVAR